MASEPVRLQMVAHQARAARLFLAFSLTCALLLIGSGVVLTLIGAGEHMDVLVKRGDIEARFINASPGVVLALVGAVFFWLCRPRVRFRDDKSEDFEDLLSDADLTVELTKPPRRRRTELADLTEEQKRRIIVMSEATGGPSELAAAHAYVQRTTRRRKITRTSTSEALKVQRDPFAQPPSE